ncbi:hypothetical protein PDESU_04838 [Pontiella desulfatans]|uniref:Uncharacterized protein n=1 Tax=Pontiella desulfatans TaxID=2750659 RepID=A0A6C2U947_PONDE|nr:hypothetical protein [Pontiella desulfatans]VGO16247.1 hypothetical protein PDESU_04838 [Pontiella desulfatans]
MRYKAGIRHLFLVTGWFAVASAPAAIYYGEFFGDTGDWTTAAYTALGKAGTGDSVPGYDLMLDAGSNPQYGIYSVNRSACNARYFRFRNDLRGSHNCFAPQGGSGLVPVNGTIWNAERWSNEQSGEPIYLKMADGNRPNDDQADGLGAPRNGFNIGLNWVLVGSTDGPGIGRATDSSGAGVYAIGIVWDDVDADGYIDAGDHLYLRYVLGADSFSEIDTTAELNAAIEAVPESESEPGTETIGLLIAADGGSRIVRPMVVM